MRICAAGPLTDPQRYLIDDRRAALAKMLDRVCAAEEKQRALSRVRLEKSAAKLEALDPSGVLDRGYAYVSVDRAVVSSAKDVEAGAKARIHFRDGHADVSVIKTTVTE